MKTVKARLGADMAGHSKGDVVSVQVDSRGVPLERFWRRRFKDAEIDNCLVVVKSEKPRSKKESDK